MENNYLEQVKEFHKFFGHPISSNPSDSSNIDLKKLRVKLLFEELTELSSALGLSATMRSLCAEYVADNSESFDSDTVDKVETLDALCDLQYVLSGAVISMGYTDVFNDSFNHVHMSNMSKACNNESELNDTLKYYEDTGVDVISSKIEDKYIVYRKYDMKVLKNKYYMKTELSKFI